jgi:hypothetical protein
MSHRIPLVALALTVVLATIVPAAGAAPARPAFPCGTVSGGVAHSRPVHVADVRLGRHARFDRFVVEFTSRTVPRFSVIAKSSAVFRLDPSNRKVTLLGTAGIKLVMRDATGLGSYSGPLDFRPGFPQLREARRIGDVEGVTTWGLGLRHQTCTRVTTLLNPARLVIDVPS